ncbi:MAG: gamma-glutamylcyclotransferase [Gammaproteobacteria bacterium]|nr:gamma-glutamylcyclotransferase [Gammaproteobacteria bacterium]
MQHLFVYGTLAPGKSNAHILEGVTGTWRPGSIRGSLHPEGWGATLGYPAVVLDDAGEEIPGLLFSSAELEKHWDRLDEFEGEAYERVLARVVLEDGGTIDAYVYALRNKPRLEN